MGLVKTRRLAAMRKHPVARRAQIQKKGFKMMTRDAARRMFRDVAVGLLVVGYAACPIHNFVSCAMSGALATGQIVLSALIALPALFFKYWGVLSAAVGLCVVVPMFCH